MTHVGRYGLSHRGGKKVPIFLAVQEYLRPRAALPVDHVPHASRARVLIVRAAHAVAGAYVARRPHEVINVAVQTWQLGNLLRGNDFGDFLRVGVHGPSFSRHHFYRSYLPGTGQLPIDSRAPPNTDFRARLECRKSRTAHGHFIRPGSTSPFPSPPILPSS